MVLFLPSMLWFPLAGWQEGHPACKKTEWWGAGIVTCLQRGADLHMAQLMPLPLTVSCFSKILTGFTFLVPAHPGSPGQRAVKRACVVCCSCVDSTRMCGSCQFVLFDRTGRRLPITTIDDALSCHSTDKPSLHQRALPISSRNTTYVICSCLNSMLQCSCALPELCF